MVTVKDFLNSPSLSEIKLIAGHNGLDREIRAVSVMDAPDSYKWLKGGEVILTTGYMFGDDSWLLEHYTSSLINAGASGLGIKKGRFISKIPDSVLELARENRFPVFEIPYPFGWSVIILAFHELYLSREHSVNPEPPQDTSVFYRQITDGYDAERVYRDLILGVKTSSLSKEDIRKAESLRAEGSIVYACIALLKTSNTIEAYRLMRKAIMSRRIEKTGRVNCHMVDNTAENEAMLLLELSAKDGETPERWQFLFLEELEYYMQDMEDVCIGIGSISANLNEIPKSYREAREACELGAILWQSKRCFLYEMVASYSAMRAAGTASLCLNYVNALNDSKSGLMFDGVETLEAFIECGGYKKAAAKLFIHENTMRYRIQKIGDYLHLNPDDAMNCHMLITQIKLWKMR